MERQIPNFLHPFKYTAKCNKCLKKLMLHDISPLSPNPLYPPNHYIFSGNYSDGGERNAHQTKALCQHCSTATRHVAESMSKLNALCYFETASPECRRNCDEEKPN